MKKKMALVSAAIVVVVICLIIIFNNAKIDDPDPVLLEKYPYFFNLDTSEGIEVHAILNVDDDYRYIIASAKKPDESFDSVWNFFYNRAAGKDAQNWSELVAFMKDEEKVKAVTATEEEMKIILDWYRQTVPKNKISVGTSALDIDKKGSGVGTIDLNIGYEIKERLGL